MPYSSTSVANGVLELGFRDAVPIDPMKLQKLLFFMHGYYIALRDGDPLLNEPFQAWKLGPVIPSIYHKLKKFRGGLITEYGVKHDREDGSTIPVAPPETDIDYISVRDFVWTTYGRLPSMKLSNITHIAGKAWDRTLKAAPGILGPQISNLDIQKDFEPLIRRA